MGSIFLMTPYAVQGWAKNMDTIASLLMLKMSLTHTDFRYYNIKNKNFKQTYQPII